MSAFEQALANAQQQNNASSSNSSANNRGQGSAAPSVRGVGVALRAAGIGAKGERGSEAEGGRRGGGGGRPARTGARSQSMDQVSLDSTGSI